MYVWMLLESIDNFILFNNEDHLLPSVQVSYCKCLDVKLERMPADDPSFRKFKVSGRRRCIDGNGDVGDLGASLWETFEHIVSFQRIPVYDSPSHL